MGGSTRVKHRKTIKLPRKFVPKFWSEVDGRSGVKKEVMKWYRELVADSGADSCQKRLLCQRAAFLNVQLETMEREAADGDAFEPGVHTQMVNAFSGLLTKLGLSKKQHGQEGLQSYLKRRA